MLNLKKNEEFKFDLEYDSVILINKMIKESIDPNLIKFRIQLEPGYKGKVRFLLNIEDLELSIFDENDHSFTVNLIDLGIFEFSDYFEVDDVGICINKESLTYTLVLSAKSNSSDKEVFNTITEIIKNCEKSFYTKKGELSFKKVSFNNLTIKRFENNLVVIDYFYQLFKLFLKEHDYQNSIYYNNKRLEFLFKIFSDFYSKKEKELEELRIEFIKKSLETNSGLNSFIDTLQNLFFEFPNNEIIMKNSSFRELEGSSDSEEEKLLRIVKNSSLLDVSENSNLFDEPEYSKNSEQEKLFKGFMEFFSPKELSISVIVNRKLLPVIEGELFKRLKEKQLTFKNCGYNLSIRNLSDYQFNTLIRFLKANNSKLEVLLSIENELINDEIYFESEILMLNRLEKLKKLSKTTPVTFKGIDNLSQFIQAKINLMELIQNKKTVI